MALLLLASCVLIGVLISESGAAPAYVVRPGDTLWDISQAHGCAVAELKALNDLDSDVIHPGQRLEVAGCGAAKAPDSPSTRTPDLAVLLTLCPVADGFDFPVGDGDAIEYYDAQKFGENDHLGEDWNGVGGGDTDFGDPVLAVADGVVIVSRDYLGGWGNVVRIVHNIGSKEQPRYVESFSAHLDRVEVEAGQVVRRGQLIGTIGDAHGLYLAHLHFEMRDRINMPVGPGYSSERAGYLDPTAFIKRYRQLGQ